MDSKFLAHVKTLRPQLQLLLNMQPVTPESLPNRMPRKGIYLLSKGTHHLYIGRSNNIRKRIAPHSRPGATYRMASFAFRLAREATGNLRPSYKKDKGSRAGLMEDKAFAKAFISAKARIRKMELRFVEEVDPVRQALLEIYAAVVLGPPYNDFNTN